MKPVPFGSKLVQRSFDPAKAGLRMTDLNMGPFYFVTSNKGKAKEVEIMLGRPLEVVSLELDEIQSLDTEEIITKKVIEAFKKVNKPVIVDDAGLYLDAWGGFPGPFVKFIYKAGGYELLLKMMSSEENRTAIFKASIGFHDGTTAHTFHGEVKGTIPLQAKGTDGWGYDPIFIPEGYDKTFAELGNEIKNTLSHRSRAVEKFKQYLDAQK